MHDPTYVILADSGDSTGYRPRTCNYNLQHSIYKPHRLKVSVADYPSGCRQRNPIEHRAFSEVSENWPTRPLDKFQTIVNYIRTTVTRNQLRRNAQHVAKEYRDGVKIAKN